MTEADMTTAPTGPDLTQGIDAESLADGSMLTGHVGSDAIAVVEGDPDARDCAVTYYQNGRALATATIYRDSQSLSAELMMQQAITKAGDRHGVALIG